MPNLLLSVLFDRITQPVLGEVPTAAPPHPAYYWHLPVLIIVISLVYSATRFEHWGPILREAVRWGIRLTVFLFAIIIVLYAVANFI
jgi:hypothetical protein